MEGSAVGTVPVDFKAKSVLVKKLIGNENGKRDCNVRLPFIITVLME